ncbi:unnamed protein product [Owenia fusiformis]|uniref:Uncharacterized protein n=1 Tax=Owenia fusiformis TaxID=6347 RepID=A0A8J1TVV8_OWEFU|nr:unnamed protein product [Owenia fusiformis]
MKDEIASAVVFLTAFIKKNENLSKEQVKEFSAKLSQLFVDKFKNHWYDDCPTKGQGYRCIRINESRPFDPVLEKAANDVGVKYEDLKLPTELTLWVDPMEVCCRFGENHGACSTVASFDKLDSAGESNGESTGESSEGSGDETTPVTPLMKIDEILKQHELSSGTKSQERFLSMRLNKNGTPKRANGYTTPGNNQNHQRINSKARNNYNNYQNKAKQQFMHGPKKTFPQYHPHHLPTGFNPYATGPLSHPHPQPPTSRNDKFHWVRGHDLIKASPMRGHDLIKS